MQKKLKIVLTSLNKSKKSAHCLRRAGHAPVGLSKRGRDAILYLFIVYIQEQLQSHQVWHRKVLFHAYLLLMAREVRLP